MDAQTQDVVRQILLKLGGLESSVARQDETLKAVQDSLLAVQGDAKDAQQEAKTNQARVEDNLRSQQDELCDDTFSYLTTRVLGLLHLLGLGEVQVEVHSYDGAVDTIDRRYALTLLEE